MNNAREQVLHRVVDNNLKVSRGADYIRIILPLVTALGGKIENRRIVLPENWQEDSISVESFLSTSYWNGFHDALLEKGDLSPNLLSKAKEKYSAGYHIGRGMIQGYQLLSNEIKSELRNGLENLLASDSS